MAVGTPFVLYVGEGALKEGKDHRRRWVAGAALGLACVAVLVLSASSAAESPSGLAAAGSQGDRGEPLAKQQQLFSFRTNADDGKGVDGGQQHGVTRTISACDGDDPACVFEVSPEGYQEGRWVHLKDGKAIVQPPGTIRVRADHAKPSSWEDDVGDRRSRLSRSDRDGVFRAPVRPARPAYTVQSVAFPDALRPRAAVDRFDADLRREGGRAPQDESEYVRREAASRVEPRGGARQEVQEAPRGARGGGGRQGRVEGEQAGEVGTDGEAEAPGPLQAVATEIAVESRKYEGLLARVKDATETEDALLADMQASRTKLGNLMTRQRNMVGRLAGGEEEGEAPRAPETVRDAPAVQEVQAPGGEEAPRGEERAEEEVQPEARAVAEEPAGRETESPKHVEEPGGVEEPAGVEEREPVAAAQGEPVAGFEGRFLFDPDMNADEIKDQDEYFTYGLQQKHLPVARTAVVDVIDYRTDQAFRAMGSEFPIDKFIGELTGLVLIKQGGEYTFASSSDDGSHIWIDGALVVSNEGLHPVETVRGTLDLTAGYHTVKVDFFEAEGGSAIWVEYSGPDTGGEDELLRAVHHVATLTAPTPPSGGGEPLDGFEARVIFDPEMDSGEIKDEGDYFRFAQETRHLPVSLTATVDTIDYHTDEAFRALGPGFDLDKFVVQWRGVFEVATEGYYTFASSSDDGSHIWIDGALVVSNEGLHPVETVKNTVKLNAGYHTVRVDFFENEGGAAISVKYSGPDTGGEEELLRGKHYPSAAPAPTATLPEVDGVVPLAGFVGRFFFDPQMNGDAIKDQDDYVKFAEEVRHLPVSVTDVTSVISYRHDVAFGFESRLDKFIGEWTGLVHISEAGAYTFASSSDDGSHIWIDGAMVVSNKGLHPVETVRGTVYLSPGYHTVKVDFFENQGGAAIWVNYWGPDTQGKEALLRGVHVPPPVPLDAALLPGFEAKFIFDPDMNGDEIKDQADYFASAKERGLTVSKTAVVDAINYGYDETFRSVAPDFPLDKFIAQWTGVVQIAEAGAYSFSSSSDDGSHIWIDGALVVSNEGLHGTQEVRGTVDLTAGYHTVKVDFFEAEGGSAIWVEYSGPDTGGEDRLLRALHYGAAGDPPSNTLLVESEDHGVCGAFAVHARTNITFAGVQSTIRSGDIGVSPGTAITGDFAFEQGGGVEPESAAFAASVLAAHAAAMAVRPDGHAMPIEMGGETFTPGTYRSDSAINIAAGTVVTLDGLNEANPVFLFQAVSNLVTAADTSFILTNGANADNVLWALGTAATLGANSVLPGSILAGSDISFGTKAELNGCALAQSFVAFASAGSVALPH